MSSSGAAIADASRRYFNRWAAHYDRSVARLWFQENHRPIERWLQPSHFAIASATELHRYCSRAGFRQVRVRNPRWFLMLGEAVRCPS